MAYATAATPADFHQRMYMLANLAVGGNWANAPVGETADLRIDYIRAFSRDGANPAVVQDVISSPDGRGHSFHGATDANGDGPKGAIDLAPLPGTTPADLGSGDDILDLAVSGDGTGSGTRFTVTVDGRQVGDVQTVTASHSLGQTQSFHVHGDFRPGSHAVVVQAVGAAAPGGSVHLATATIDDEAVPDAGVALGSFAFQGSTSAPVTIGFGPDALSLSISEDAWRGHARFDVLVDGTKVGATQTATAAHSNRATQDFEVRGTFAPGNHTLSLKYVNDVWGGSPDTDRNLHLDKASLDGTTVPGGTLMLLLLGGTQRIAFMAPASALGSGPEPARPAAPATTPQVVQVEELSRDPARGRIRLHLTKTDRNNE